MRNTLPITAVAAVAIGAVVSAPAGALAHAVCGARIFPATLGIDDPGAGDEFSTPTLAYLPSNSDGEREFDVGAFAWSKTIFSPNVDVIISDGATFLHPGGSGWEPLSTEVQWGNFCADDHELIATLGFEIDWANTGTGSQAQSFNTYQPVIDIGKGFGDLPQSLQSLRALGTTFELSETLPGEKLSGGSPNSTNLNGGFAIQYSLPYYNSQVAAIGNDFLRHLIPITEFTFSKPIANFAPGTNETTGTIQPGVIYQAATYQVGAEAIIPLNRASGFGAGAIFSIDFYLDDLLPNSLGKPLFGLQ